MPDSSVNQSQTWKARARAEFKVSSDLMIRVERLEDAARALVEADCVLHASAPAEKWERYTQAIVRLREALDA